MRAGKDFQHDSTTRALAKLNLFATWLILFQKVRVVIRAFLYVRPGKDCVAASWKLLDFKKAFHVGAGDSTSS